ncbi:MAG: FAD-dependent oxidoreductase [bacterium]|nr:FAD-dependent oxidoreductase [bacterium]
MPERKRILVVGGSAAGPKAAARARRLDEEAEIIILQKAPDLSMASCGYPYYVGGVFNERSQLLSTATGVIRDPKFYLNAKNIIAKTETETVKIDRARKTVTARNLRTGAEETLAYDRLILATGALPKQPPLPGIDLAGVTALHSLADVDYLRQVRDEKKTARAVIIGGGLIGIEAAEALRLAGLEVTVVEMLPQILAFLDWELAKLVENHVRSKKVNVLTGNGIAGFKGENGKLAGVKLADGTELPAELAIVAIGVSPNAKLAREAGLEIGKTGGIAVNKYLQTSDQDIYAAGDCVESENLITSGRVHAPFGDLANLEGRVAGENAVRGNQVVFPGVIQTGICKVFDYTAGSTGLSEKAAREAGQTGIETVISASPDKPGYMKGLLLVTKLVVGRKTERILGAQVIGPGDASRQLSQWAVAIKGKLTVEDMANADLPYHPNYSSAIDHGIATAHIMQNKLRGLMRGVSATEVKKKIEAGEKPFLLDARGPDEFEQMRLGLGEHLIPLGALRKRLGEMPPDKNAEIICYCKISLRGYEAARVLMQKGWTNVKVMEGGLMAWPYPREK